MVEMVIAHQAAVRLTAELAVFLFVELFEDRTLIPTRTLVAAHRFAQVIFRDIHHSNLEHLIRI